MIRNTPELDKFSGDKMKLALLSSLSPTDSFIASSKSALVSMDTLQRKLIFPKNPFLSSDVRNVGFFLCKSAEKVVKELFATTMMKGLTDFLLAHADSNRYICGGIAT